MKNITQEAFAEKLDYLLLETEELRERIEKILTHLDIYLEKLKILDKIQIEQVNKGKST